VRLALFAKNAAKVGAIGASKKPKAGKLLPLGKNGKFPASVLPGGVKGPPGAEGARGPAAPSGRRGPPATWARTASRARPVRTTRKARREPTAPSARPAASAC
jgi:hypothetical protein